MTLPNLQAILLAAGKSSRFQTGKTKLLEKICGQEMILYATRLLEQLSIPTSIVVGFQKEQVSHVVKEYHGDLISFVTQETQRGTGHALLCSKELWKHDNILIMNGDVPLIPQGTITELYFAHQAQNAAISFVIAHNADPSLGSYGRVVKEDNQIEIVEAKHFTGDPNKHCCINAGIYIINRKFLENSIAQIKPNESTAELYITDLVKMASMQGLPVVTVEAPFDRIRGINTLQELWIAEQIKRGELIKYWMDRGVHFSVAQNVHIDLDVTIGAGTKIGCGVHLLGKTEIGINCEVHEFSSLHTSTIGDNTIIFPHSIIKDTTIGCASKIGPFAHIHTQSHIGDHSVIGNFVEVKKSFIGNHTKAKHHAYLGDAHIGSNVNIGAGTIICNHNGATKNTTIINDGAYIGSNNTLVAPLTIGKQAFTAAGSVITDAVPAEALAIGRSRQVNKEGYAKKIKERAQQQTADLPISTPLKDSTTTPID
ncbi:MAG TPA: bifunctional UDP-N-acetylglucosamine diphosphorylase/glucosamine-1-phosphate N-acetyltransferase GlmU [Candidatus Babeliales bacterium]|nr:bifunctional UDP-N-acetylglucosamine diphosphorylase/glucosamine-1-phosphate N-acetyltransferase GlmU [Candidatus Babeliales bacterium]